VNANGAVLRRSYIYRVSAANRLSSIFGMNTEIAAVIESEVSLVRMSSFNIARVEGTAHHTQLREESVGIGGARGQFFLLFPRF
jgi:hypothetical protein